MGFPASGKESLYRNPLPEVQRFFEKRHGIERVFVVNLCSEKEYEHNHFANVCRIGFRDHNAPPLGYMLVFCRAADQFLQLHPDNIIAVHCKAGKGRTGVMICCLLLYTRQCKSAEEALKFYGHMRTRNGKGVTIPSQRRYVRYFDQCLRYGFPKRPYARVRLHRIVLSSTPSFDLDGGSDPYFIFTKHESSSPKIGADGEELLFDSRSEVKPRHYGKREKGLTFEFDVELQGDIRLTCIDKDRVGKDDHMFWCWFNTSFVAHGDFNGTGSSEKGAPPTPQDTCVCVFHKNDLDGAIKDKDHKRFDAEFTMTVYFEILDPETREHMEIGETASLGDIPQGDVDCKQQ